MCTQDKLALRLIAVAIGCSCLTPGLAIANLGAVDIQPAVLLFAFYIILSSLAGLRLPVQPMLWALANMFGFLISYSLASNVEQGHQAQYVAFESLYYAIAAVGFGSLLIVPLHRRGFLNGYLVGALVSSGVGIIQAVVSLTLGLVLPLTNSHNFSLVYPVGRAVAFTPEASTLAAFLLPAFVCVWVEHRRSDSFLCVALRGRFALLLLLGGLIATRSSMLLLSPAVLLVTVLFFARSWEGFISSSGRILAACTLAGMLFLPIYQTRMEGGDDAGWSQAWRTLKISAGLKIFADNPILGAGPGYVSDQVAFSRYLDIPGAMAWMKGEPEKGVDSTPVRLLAEGGFLGLVLTYYPIFVFWRRARAVACTPEWRPLFSLVFPLILAQAVALGYRDLITLLLPSVLFAVANRSSISADPPRHAIPGDGTLVPHRHHAGRNFEQLRRYPPMN